MPQLIEKNSSNAVQVQLDTTRIKQAFSFLAGKGIYRRAGVIAGMGRQSVYDYVKGNRSEVVDTDTERMVINAMASAIIEVMSEEAAAALEGQAAAMRAGGKRMVRFSELAEQATIDAATDHHVRKYGVDALTFRK